VVHKALTKDAGPIVMRDIHKGILYVADAPSIREVKILYDHEIQAVIDVAANELAAQLPREFIYCRFPLIDGDGNRPQLLKIAVTTIVTLLQSNTRTVVACSAGMSRSPAIAAAAVSRLTGEPPDTCLQSITQNGPHDVSPLFWLRVKAAMEEG
jgi:predicted protein tyrosine phosphatase